VRWLPEAVRPKMRRVIEAADNGDLVQAKELNFRKAGVVGMQMPPPVWWQAKQRAEHHSDECSMRDPDER